VAARYSEGLAGLPLVAPREAPWARHVFHLYVVQVDGRDAVRRELAQAGIASGLHYPVPLHLQEAYAALGLTRGAFPVSERVAERCLSLPMFPHLSDAQVDGVARALADALAVRGPATKELA
jgi:dTDP-4-amino-4,6-dideoxygalactose transaminase